MTDVFVLAQGSSRENKFAHPQVTKLTKAKVHVYSDSVLCLGKVTEPEGAAMSRIRQYGNAEECEFTGNSSLVDSARSRHVPGNRARDDLLDIKFFFTRTLLDCEDL